MSPIGLHTPYPHPTTIFNAGMFVRTVCVCARFVSLEAKKHIEVLLSALSAKVNVCVSVHKIENE